jgi:hypothetical protein
VFPHRSTAGYYQTWMSISNSSSRAGAGGIGYAEEYHRGILATFRHNRVAALVA